MAREIRKPLGQRLTESGVINTEQLELALSQQQKTGKLLGETLHDLGFISEDTLLTALADQAKAKVIDLRSRSVDPQASEAVPQAFARRHKLVPLSLQNDTLTVAMANPLDVVAADDLQQLTGRYVAVMAAKESDVFEAIDRVYGTRGEARRVVDVIKGSPRRRNLGADAGEPGVLEGDTPVIKVVETLIEKAVEKGATDIHIEPEEGLVRVRFRIDGRLREEATFPKELQPAIISRVKIIANLNIAENRLAQDGRVLFLTASKRRIDLRVSTFPTVHGENVVLRVLDRERMVLGLEKLGMSPENLAIFKKPLERPHGLILVTGPTGSGKTTTLYSALSHLNSLERNIITLEDPVEYELPLIRQSQVNPKAGLTFASGLRAVLRQDPDVILIGEIRDNETAEMAVRSALTGHLVFSTLHANDAVSAIPRLLDMGIEPFLLASSLVAVMAQRLVRTICTACREPAEPSAQLAALAALHAEAKEITCSQGRGCRRCDQTGYRGRTGIFEILLVTSEMSRLIATRADSEVLREQALKGGMRPLLHDGLEKVAQGMTTLEAVLREVMAV
ncbi:MAG: type II/IV secretion system protein [Nitrospinae bacterium]|nr:type II/IV secretion system protein [Nitrospinota bacterium]